MVFFLSVVKKKRSIFNLKSAESQKPKIKNLFLFFLFFVHRSSSHRFISLLILFLRFPFLFLFLFFFFCPRRASNGQRQASHCSHQRREEQRRAEKQRADRTHTIHISLFFDLLGHSPFPLLGSGILLLRVDGGGEVILHVQRWICSYAYSYAYTFVLLYIELYIYIYILITRILLPYHYYKLICIR